MKIDGKVKKMQNRTRKLLARNLKQHGNHEEMLSWHFKSSVWLFTN